MEVTWSKTGPWPLKNIVDKHWLDSNGALFDLWLF